jgi:hypothetical protein
MDALHHILWLIANCWQESAGWSAEFSIGTRAGSQASLAGFTVDWQSPVTDHCIRNAARSFHHPSFSRRGWFLHQFLFCCFAIRPVVQFHFI